jgi:hypothetical protein
MPLWWRLRVRLRRTTVSAADDGAHGRLRVSSRASLRRVQLHSLTDECPQRRFIHHVPLTEINGAVAFMTQHLGMPIPSPALMEKISTRFRRSVESFAAASADFH